MKIVCLGASNTEECQIPDVVTSSNAGSYEKMSGTRSKVLNVGCGGTTIMQKGNLLYRISPDYKQAKEMESGAAIFDSEKKRSL